MDDDVIQLGLGQAVGTEIQPDEIRSFGFYQLYFWQLPLLKFSGALVVGFQIASKLVQPRLAIGIGSLAGEHAQGVRLAVSDGGDSLPEAAAQGRIFDEDIGYLQACQVKGLAGGGAGDGMQGNFL